MSIAAAGAENMSASPPQPAPARKRRRRTAATGAAEDCFACRKRQTPCDRIRPFCGQCLELGKECSGYRTVLTWGVGVASRGKLRGMSLPVPAAPTSGPKQDASSRVAKAEKSPPLTTTNPVKKHPETTQVSPTKRKRSSVKTEPDLEAFNSTFNTSLTAPPYTEWQAQPVVTHPTTERSRSFTSNPRPNPPLQLSVDGLPLHAPPSLSSSITGSTSYTNSPWEQQSEYSASSESPIFTDPFENPQGQSRPLKANGHRLSLPSYRVFPQMGGVSPSAPNDMNLWNNGAYAAQIIPNPPDSNDPPFPFDEDTSWSFSISPNMNESEFFLDGSAVVDEDGKASPATSNALFRPIPRSSLDMPFFHLPRRMQALLDYYDKAICPVLVAFDDTSNPYRFHIMHFAMQNPGLQNAIAALVTNNMRMKEYKHVPRLKNESENATAGVLTKPTPEEQHYKAVSIQQLNSQLADMSKASDDSVLATLLILCLFHVCNSGFSKFKTQLAGVQKLLRLRNRESRSEFVGWVEMFFAWFDVMTSAVNDRETEIRGDSLDMMDLSANLGALERFSGCDGRLFKLIARLGRLNLLSQNRPVRYDPTAVGVFNQSHPESFPDQRDAFWTEWHDTRERLHAWRFTPSETYDDSIPVPLTQKNLEDISEAFRYSALLYTERLAYPQLPSSSNNFQVLVGRSLSHIEAIGVNSCVTKFMLWPLFITGTECVEERDRDLIRDRCVEIQEESGFYNNLSGLHVLERVWQENDATGPGMQPYSGQAFRWRKAMDRVDGEYIVI